jgi:TRAP-type C4-dicarboxylate transport system permease small subunit
VKNVLGDWVERICMLLVAALAVIVFLQVFNRFILKAPLAWSEDLAMLLFQWVAFLGAAVGVQRTRHFGIELAVKRMPTAVRHWIEIGLIPLVVGAVAVVMIVQGISLLKFNYSRIYASMDLSYLWAYLPIPVSGALILVFLIQKEIERLMGMNTRKN